MACDVIVECKSREAAAAAAAHRPSDAYVHMRGTCKPCMQEVHGAGIFEIRLEFKSSLGRGKKGRGGKKREGKRARQRRQTRQDNHITFICKPSSPISMRSPTRTVGPLFYHPMLALPFLARPHSIITTARFTKKRFSHQHNKEGLHPPRRRHAHLQPSQSGPMWFVSEKWA